MDAFESIILKIHPNPIVLDVGGGGLKGSNTTNVLIEHFGIEAITCVCLNKEVANTYAEKTAVKMIVADFYKHEFKEKFDLIVLDLNIDCNVQNDWTDEGMKRIHKMLNPNGIVICYVMAGIEVGYVDSLDMIEAHNLAYWGEEFICAEFFGQDTSSIIDDVLKQKYSKIFKVFSIKREERRTEILWVALQKISG